VFFSLGYLMARLTARYLYRELVSAAPTIQRADKQAPIKRATRRSLSLSFIVSHALLAKFISSISLELASSLRRALKLPEFDRLR